MDTLTIEKLTTATRDLEFGIWPEFTLVYIRSLLSPYFEVMDTIEDIATLKAWIQQAFKGNLSVDVLTNVNTTIAGVPHPNALPMAIHTAATSLLFIIIDRLVASAGVWEDLYFVPWEVQRVIAEDADLSAMFGITPDHTTLPVEVTFGTSTFTHMVTFDFFGGLVSFSAPWFSGQPLNLSMFGVPIPADAYKEEAVGFHFVLRNVSPFELVFVDSGVVQAFGTVDFLRGLLTGCEWMNFDRNAVKYKLIQYDDTDQEDAMLEGNDVTF